VARAICEIQLSSGSCSTHPDFSKICVFVLGHAGDAAVAIEQDGARAGGALIEGRARRAWGISNLMQRQRAMAGAVK
jgi:hypothetical protein